MSEPATSELERQHDGDCQCTRCTGFLPGHKLSLRHGSYVGELRLSEDSRVLEIAAAIRESQPVSHHADEGAISRLAIIYRRLEISAIALDEADRSLASSTLNAYTDKAAWLGRLREDHERWHRLAGRLEEQLARTPASRGRLGLHLALAERSLADLAATGAEIRKRRGIAADDE